MIQVVTPNGEDYVRLCSRQWLSLAIHGAGFRKIEGAEFVTVSW